MSALADVPRETRDKLEVYAAELRRWQRVTNLVGPGTLDEIWTRHFDDSLQLAKLAEGDVWVDLGSGAGFPGLVLAIANPALTVHLVESDSRRCAFLRHVARSVGVSVPVHDGRIEDLIGGELQPAPTVVTARAVAPLSRLLSWSEPLLSGTTTGLFPKGRDHARELTDARRFWTFDAELIPSRVDPDSRIVRVRNLTRLPPSRTLT